MIIIFVLEKTYDFDEIARNNMHTHSVFSTCAKPEMVFEDMIKTAEKCGLQTLAITDHSGPDDDIDSYANFLFLKEKLKGIQTPVRVLIGAELSAYGVGKYGEPYEVDKALDYSSYSHVHYHLDCWEQPEDRSPWGYSRHMLDTLNALFLTDRADCIAHPFSPGKMNFFNFEQNSEMLKCISDNELGDILEKGENVGCAWEIHSPTFLTYREFSKRFFLIGKEVGVHFHLGTDAHTLAALSTAGLAEKLKEAVDADY